MLLSFPTNGPSYWCSEEVFGVIVLGESRIALKYSLTIYAFMGVLISDVLIKLLNGAMYKEAPPKFALVMWFCLKVLIQGSSSVSFVAAYIAFIKTVIIFSTVVA